MSDRTPGSPASRRQTRNRAAILSAARSLIVEQGVDGVSLRQIAARADYSPAALYEYFPSKDALVAELAQGASDQLYETLAAIKAPEPLVLLERLSCGYVDWALAHREDFLLVFGRLGSSRTSAAQPVGERSAFLVVMRAVESAIAAGALRPGPGFGAHEITYSLWALVHGQAMLQTTHLAGFQADFAVVDRAAVRCFLSGLAGPRPPSPKKRQR